MFCIFAGVAAVPWWPGLDVRYELMRWISEVFGDHANYVFVIWLHFLSYWLGAATFSLFTLLALVPALFMAPGRFSWATTGIPYWPAMPA